MGSQQDSALLRAIEAGDAAALAEALAAGAQANRFGAESVDDPLFHAAKFNRPGLVDALMAAGADPWKMDGKSLMPLGCAMGFGHWEVMERMLADVRWRDPECLAWAWKIAVVEERLGAFEPLLAAGVDIEGLVALPDETRASPLGLAAKHGSVGSVKALLSLGADPNSSYSTLSTSRPRNLRAAGEAIHSGHSECLKALLDSGARVELPESVDLAIGSAQRGETRQILSLLLSAGEDFTQGDMGSRFMAAAALACNRPAIVWLFDRGVDPAMATEGGRSALEASRDRSGFGIGHRQTWELIEALALSCRERSEIMQAAAEGAPRQAAPRRM